MEAAKLQVAAVAKQIACGMAVATVSDDALNPPTSVEATRLAEYFKLIPDGAVQAFCQSKGMEKQQADEEARNMVQAVQR